MSDTKKQSGLSSLLPQQWMAVLVFLAGFAAVNLSSLDSTRPTPEGSPPASKDGSIALSNLEDPFAIVPQSGATAAGTSSGSESKRGQDPNASDDTKSFKRPDGVPNDGKFRIVMVFMKSPSDSFEKERRRTDRQAIASALSARNYIPSENRRLRLYLGSSRGDAKPASGKGVQIPYEWWHQSKTVDPPENVPVLVMWLSSEEFVPKVTKASGNTRSVFRELHEIARHAESNLSGSSLEQVDVFGPSDTDALVSLMVSEGLWKPSGSQAPWSKRFQFHSPMATASDRIILEEYAGKRRSVDSGFCCPPGSVNDVMDSLLLIASGQKGNSAPRFVRTIATDDEMAECLVRELASRGVSDRVNRGKKSILLISELDSLYGRNLPEDFRNAWNRITSGKDRSRIKSLTYFKGLDGRFQTAAKDKGGASGDGGGSNDKGGAGDDAGKAAAGNGAVRSYEPRGIAQSDSLRRIGFEMRYADDELDDVIAVGVLGSDVFDKLLVIRALRPVMKDAFFFTNGLDAWMWDSKEIDTTQGMITAAPAGVEMGDILSEETLLRDKPLRVLPFRNSYQSVLFRSAYYSLGPVGISPENPRKPSIYEIDRSGPVRIDGRPKGWAGLLLFQPPVLALIFGPIPIIMILRRAFARYNECGEHGEESGLSRALCYPASLWNGWGTVERTLSAIVGIGFAVCMPLPLLMAAWFWAVVAVIASGSRKGGQGLKSADGWLVPGISVPAFVILVSVVEIMLFFGNKREVFFGNRMGAWFYVSMISLGVLFGALGLWQQYEAWMKWRDNPDGSRPGQEKYQLDQVLCDSRGGGWTDVMKFERIFRWRGSSEFRVKGLTCLAVAVAVIAIFYVAFGYLPHFWALRVEADDLPLMRVMEPLVSGAAVVLHSVLWLVSFWMLAWYRVLLQGLDRKETHWSEGAMESVLPILSDTDLVGDGFERVKRDCTDLHYLADRSREWSMVLMMPFLVLLPMSAGGLLMDMAPRWSWLVCSVMTLGSGAVVAMGYVCHYKLMRMREDVVREVQTVPGLTEANVNALTGSLLGLEHGLFRPFGQQPVVRLFVIALGLIGTNEVVKEVVRRM